MNSNLQEKPDVRIECSVEGAFGTWLAQARGSLAVSTYQAGKVALVGWDGQQVSLLMRHFDKPLGMAVDGNRMALATRHEVILFANAQLLAHAYLENQPGRYDALFLPRVSYFSGNLHLHDVAYGSDGLWVVNTRFCCLARLSEAHNFEPTWRPPFVTDLVPEDRCHLNGLAMRDGQPKYVTVLGETDTPGGWREDKAHGGAILDVATGEVICRGLSMPHSPRWYDERLWVLNSGNGELLEVDPKSGAKTVIASLPGYLRGLAFAGPFALIGLSHIREKHIFGGLPLQEREDSLRCGVAVVDLRNGTTLGMLDFTSGCTELYDVQFLPGILRPTILNAEKEAVRQAVTNPESSYWLRPSSEIKDDSDTGDEAQPPPSTESAAAEGPATIGAAAAPR